MHSSCDKLIRLHFGSTAMSQFDLTGPCRRGRATARLGGKEHSRFNRSLMPIRVRADLHT
jgi:hypothetical protein